MKGRIAVITGGIGDIGTATCQELTKLGAKVIAVDFVSADKAALWQNKQKEEGYELGYAQVDVSDFESCAEMAKDVEKRFGPVDILVNNAAVTHDNLLLRMKEDEWFQVMETNLNSVYRLTKICLRDMIKARWGRVINIGSVVGSTGNPGQTNYAATKAGVVGFAKALACEVGARHITVNTVAPGFVDTDMTRKIPEAHREILLQKIPLQRLGQVDDIASAVVFLASEKASYITGQTLHVNGGMYMN